ncbi:hypothetical protein OE749_10900 [Aestuariibacter sp. AA17]|uniref:DUF6868 domain-containing protein n=1 Tax=Fluctibacter corallii TaxID=2984329 RepID=A0ABT3A970_9ALTE|nr:hypothetical protein [Aestuariibacter sp. AA17]MCV2885199.1 hypothetical protein [Aestuariibacter sp. AA17]
MQFSEFVSFFGWMTVVNYAILCLWLAIFGGAKQHLFFLHTRFFRLTEQQFDLIHYCGMGLYKLLIIAFSLTPFLVMNSLF